MKYIKSYENTNEDYDVKVGDTLYCIDNKGVERDLEIGRKYTVDNVYISYNGPLIFRLAETGSRWMKFRFSPDPNHINIVKMKANKYNL